MCEKCKETRDEKFHTRLVTDDEAHYVETDYTIGELEETLKIVNNWAIIKRDPSALKIASLFALTTKQFDAAVQEFSITQVWFNSFREAVKEIQKLPSRDIKEALDSLLTLDEGVSAILLSTDEFM